MRCLFLSKDVKFVEVRAFVVADQQGKSSWGRLRVELAVERA